VNGGILSLFKDRTDRDTGNVTERVNEISSPTAESIRFGFIQNIPLLMLDLYHALSLKHRNEPVAAG
jgi:hypothetical protein